MEGKLPTPYVLEMKEGIPNMYIIGLGAGHIATLVGDALIRDSNAFQIFLGRYSNKTGLKFDKGIFSHEVFRRAFILTLIEFYSAYTSARSQYLISKNIPDSDIPVYTSFDNILITSEFLADSPYENLEEILENNIKIHGTVLSKWPEVVKRILSEYASPPESPSKEELPDKPKEEKPGLKDEKQDKNQE